MSSVHNAKALLLVFVARIALNVLLVKKKNQPTKGSAARTYKSKGVSFHPSLLKDAMNRADSLGIRFSAYVAAVVRRDISEGGPLTLMDENEHYFRSKKDE